MYRAGFCEAYMPACSSGTLEPSHVLRAMGLPSHRTQNSIRFSLGAGNTAEQVDALLAKLKAGSDVKINENVLSSYPPPTFKVVPTPAEHGGTEKAAPAPANEEE